ncbi:unnamed protein product [Linum tenue]|uniref:Dienelactone hydrolase domain-containing protein n=1 Tax=Linum tenue TaxID=586396 RepID=A0AAV0RR30_9ROSI|nr:unnamed protein product [Linum tenue]
MWLFLTSSMEILKFLAKGFEDVKPVIESLKSKGVTAIGAICFCWGEVKIPLAILGAEIDQMSPPALLKPFEAILAAKPGVDAFVKIFPGVSNGWTVRYNVEDEAAVKAVEEDQNDALEWFAKFVK